MASQSYHFHHLPAFGDDLLYPHDDSNTVPNETMSYGSSTPGLGTMKHNYLSSLVPFGYWSPCSPFDESVRSASPLTDCLSGMSTASLCYDDAMSPSSGLASPPLPSYPDPPMSMTQFENLPLQSDIQSAQPGSSPVPLLYPMPVQYVSTSPSTSSSSDNPTTHQTSLPPKKKEKQKGKVTKRSTNRIQKRSTTQQKKVSVSRPVTAPAPRTTSKPTSRKLTDRRYKCTFARYGCPSTFPSKNEWKRHVNSQHIQQDLYRCDTGRCAQNNTATPTPTSPPDSNSKTHSHYLSNYFNRKDLFIQHQRRMHAPWASENRSRRNRPVTDEEKKQFDASLEDVSARCRRRLRLPPMRTRCGFCGAEFTGETAWKDRMEHVGGHIERGDLGPEDEDIPLREWAVQEGIVRLVGGRWRLAQLWRK